MIGQTFLDATLSTMSYTGSGLLGFGRPQMIRHLNLADVSCTHVQASFWCWNVSPESSAHAAPSPCTCLTDASFCRSATKQRRLPTPLYVDQATAEAFRPPKNPSSSGEVDPTCSKRSVRGSTDTRQAPEAALQSPKWRTLLRAQREKHL